MFKNFQNNLLLKYPLIWNTKLIPSLVILVILNIVFFLTGYLNGRIDFSTNKEYYSTFNDSILIFLSILISILFFVIWYVIYCKNNAFKSFYPIGNNFLYKEWLIILVICLLNTSYSICYIYGKNLKTRSYYTYEETRKRCATISMSSVFTVGEYENFSSNLEDTLGNVILNKKHYLKNSLINRGLDEFSILSGTNYEMKVKNWMQNNNNVEVQKLLKDYITIVNEHGLKSNINAQDWFNLTYHYPDFIKYENVGRTFEANEFDDLDSKIYKYNVPQNALCNSYRALSNAWTSPLVSSSQIYFIIYLSLSLSLFFYSFKVTNGKSWLIGIVASGIISIIIGIFSGILSNGYSFLISWLLLIIGFIVYLFKIISKNEGKKFSDIVLNILLWVLPAFLPIIYALLLLYFDDSKEYTVNNEVITKNTPQYEWLSDNSDLLLLVNFSFIIITMYFVCYWIKKWRALTEA